MRCWGLSLPLVFMSAIAAAGVEQEIATCSSKEGDLDRLACFDAIAKARGLDGPQPQPVELSGTGKWSVSVDTNPIDDSTTVLLSITADSGRSSLGKPVTMFVRCKSNETELYINWSDYLGRNGTVLTRIGSNDASTKDWNLSTDSQATFHPQKGTIGFLKWMASADKFVAQITPYNESPVTAIFDITGMENALKPLRETCEWPTLDQYR